MNESETRITELMEACGYDPDEDGSVDDLIAYKDALESAYAELLDQREPEGTSITWSGEACEGFSDRIDTMHGWYVKLTTIDGKRIEASIVGYGKDVPIHGETWHDAVTYLPVDDEGLAVEDAEPRTVRVLDIYIY